MGTSYNIKIIDDYGVVKNKPYLKTQIDSILNKINWHFSTYQDSSEINLFNSNTSQTPITVSSELYYLVSRSKEIFHLSNGSFDITIKPLVDIWGFSDSFKTPLIPKEFIIDSIKQYVGLDKLILKKSTIQKQNPNIQIDLNSIAKGWTVDRISQLFKSLKLSNYMIEIGGEIYISGHSQDKELWTIGIRNPNADIDNVLYVINLTDKAIATSGTYQNFYYIDGNKYSHIINPKTGYPLKTDLVSAIIIADNCMIADAIATAVMLKGFNNGLHWINTLRDIECLLITKLQDGELKKGKSKGFIYELIE